LPAKKEGTTLVPSMCNVHLEMLGISLSFLKCSLSEYLLAANMLQCSFYLLAHFMVLENIDDLFIHSGSLSSTCTVHQQQFRPCLFPYLDISFFNLAELIAQNVI
jgi:hypothetical protein